MTQAEAPNRWYDRQPKLAQAVRLMLIFPDEIKSIISEGVMLLANREFQVSEQMNSFRTLGTDKVLGIYKSKNKRRDYDQNEVLHKAMNYLYILSEPNQDCMADHILKLVQYIQDYLGACKAFQASPTLEEIAIITNTYVERGSLEVEVFLNKLRAAFHQNLLGCAEEFQPVDFLENILDDQVAGMKIHRSD